MEKKIYTDRDLAAHLCKPSNDPIVRLNDETLLLTVNSLSLLFATEWVKGIQWTTDKPDWYRLKNRVRIKGIWGKTLITNIEWVYVFARRIQHAERLPVFFYRFPKTFTEIPDEHRIMIQRTEHNKLFAALVEKLNPLGILACVFIDRDQPAIPRLPAISLTTTSKALRLSKAQIQQLLTRGANQKPELICFCVRELFTVPVIDKQEQKEEKGNDEEIELSSLDRTSRCFGLHLQKQGHGEGQEQLKSKLSPYAKLFGCATERLSLRGLDPANQRQFMSQLSFSANIVWPKKEDKPFLHIESDDPNAILRYTHIDLVRTIQRSTTPCFACAQIAEQ